MNLYFSFYFFQNLTNFDIDSAMLDYHLYMLYTCLMFTFTEINYISPGYGLTPFHLITIPVLPTQNLPKNQKVGETGIHQSHQFIDLHLML